MKKLVYKDVKEFIESKGCRLVSTNYDTSKKQLEIQCKCGNVFFRSFEVFKRSNLCNECIKKKLSNKNKHSFEYIKSQIEKENYKLISTEYNGNKKSIKLICPEGHEYITTYNSFSRGRRCIKCSINRKPTFDEVKKYISIVAPSYKLLSKNYVDSITKLKFQCPEGHKFDMIYGAFKNQNQRCPECFGKKRNTLEYVKSKIENIKGYKLISEVYVSTHSLIEVECPKGHRYKVSYANFSQGCRCPKCPTKVSKAELEIYNLVSSYFPDAISGDRKILNGLELDIYIPSKKVAFEYCGLYWHSEQMGKNSNYHLNKLDLCKEQGIDLITIFEDEYINRSEVVISRIKNKLGVSDSERVYARKCVIKEIEPKVKNEFLNKFHLQGADSSSIKLGAFYKDKLVSVMTFSKPSISKGNYNKADTYELNRFCSDSSYSVIGIASKLFKHFTRNYEFKYCFSFGDKRWSNGNVYKNLGFEKEYDTKPNYWYVIDGERKHRYNYRKSELNKKLETFNPELSEYKNMLENDLDRIWDQGSVKWRYIK